MPDESDESPVILVVGAGPGVSASVARRFARDGFAVGLLGRDAAPLQELVEELTADGVRAAGAEADIVADPEGTRVALTTLAQDLGGRVDVLHFNPSAFRQEDPLHLSVPHLLEDVALGVGALLTAVQAVRPFLRPGSRVTATGSMAADQPWHEAASLGVQKAGLRNLVHSLDATLSPDGIRAVSVTVRGMLGEEGPFTPARVAEAIHAAAHQDESSWASEVPYSG